MNLIISQCRRCTRCWFIPWVGGSPGGGHGNPLQYPCLENPMNRGARSAEVHRVAKSRTWLKWLSISTRNVLLILVYVLNPRRFSSLPLNIKFIAERLGFRLWNQAVWVGILNSPYTSWMLSSKFLISLNPNRLTYKMIFLS